MGNTQETLSDAEREDSDFTASDWQADLMAYFGGGVVHEPRRADEFSVSDLQALFGLGRWRAREMCAQNVASGKWAVRKLDNRNLYRVVKDVLRMATTRK